MTRKRLYIIIICAATALIAAALFFIGFRLNSKSLARVELTEEISELETGITELEAQKEELSQQISEIETELSNKSTINNYYMEYQKEYDALKSETEDLKTQINEIDSEIESASAKLDSLSGITEETKGKTYTLTSDEIYTCPDKIPAGRYTAVGSGTLIITSSSGSTRVTQNLDVSYNNSYTFDLSEYEKIMVTGEVELTELK
ncbi:MAG: hypothetical protein LUF26_07880 [Firmicutes bacterium]|nr:hypothetical protein [Bacillota bacterium]